MGNKRKYIYILIAIIFSSPFVLGARYSYVVRNSTIQALFNDSIRPLDSLKNNPQALINDTSRLILAPDSARMDTAAADTTKRKAILDAVVEYQAKDSIVMTGTNWGHLFGDAQVKYTNMELKAEKISMNIDSSIAEAFYGVDTLGKKFNYPLLTQGGTDYESETMRYNFKNQKAFITNFRTKQDDGFVTGRVAKKSENNYYFMADGRYTTCDNHDHPHFYLALTKGKVEPGKKVVFGPAYMVIEDLPLPLAIPFGFFPFTSSYSSGVIMPSYADEMDRGFGLLDGGYYFAINDYADLAVTGDIYTKGSWALKARSSYRKRYKFSGSFDMSYMVTKYSDKGLPDYSLSKDARINWTHSQDPKANQYRTLSASVNYSTSSYNRNDIGNYQYGSDYSQNTKGSSVTLTQRFPESPWAINAAMNVNQRSQDSSISVTLPNLSITMSRVAPFKRKQAVGEEKWYEKIQLSYTGDFRNSIDTKDNLLFKSSFQKDWKKAMQHSIPVSATFSLFENINITPSFNYKERWYTNKVYQQISQTGSKIPTDTVNGFYRVFDFNASVSMQTKLYGMYTPVFSPTTKIRHVFTPSISFSWAPDFSDPKWGYYETFHYYDQNGRLIEDSYSPFNGGMFGVPTRGKTGAINFQFDNNLEMKIKSDKDSTGFKKISIIDNLGIGFSHNMMAEKHKWSDISTNIRLKLSKSMTVNLTAMWDPYAYRWDEKNQVVERLDELRLKKYGTIARLRSISYSIGPSINQDTFKKWFGKGDDKESGKNDQKSSSQQNTNLENSTEGEGGGARQSMFEQKQDDGEYDEDGYLKNEVKWNLSFNLGMNYRYGEFDKIKNEYKGRLDKTFSFNGSIQPTKNWNFTFNATYNFDEKRFPDINCTLTRDLHCWSISANFRPVGMYKSYFVVLRANSSLLQDLKYEQRGRTTSYDPNWD